MTEATNRKRPGSRRFGKKTAIAVLAAIVILFAFVWEMNILNRDRIDDYFQMSRRQEVQQALDELYWITLDYLPYNRYSRPGIRLYETNAIVIHYVANPMTTAWQNRSYFAGLAITGETFASSNFIICLDGYIIQCVPVYEIAYASNHRNSDTISIELCHPDETGRFTVYTYAAAVRLTAWLCYMFDLTADDIIRHYDVTGKMCPRYFVENEDSWEAFKADVAEEIRRLSESSAGQ